MRLNNLLDLARLGVAGHGMAWLGKARPGVARLGMARALTQPLRKVKRYA